MAVFDVTQYGAVGNGLTDDTIAIQSAINALQGAGGGKLFLPKGEYKITAAVNIANVPVEIEGEGRDLSVVVQHTSGAGVLVFSSTGSGPNPNQMNGHGTPFKSFKLRKITLAAANNCGIAVKAQWVPQINNQTFLSVDDVAVRSAVAANFYFTKGFELTDVNGTQFDNVYIGGDEIPNGDPDWANAQPSPWHMDYAIDFMSSTTENPGKISHFLSNLRGGWCNTFLHITGWYEGFYLDQFEFVDVQNGVFYSNPHGRNLSLENGHIDFRGTAVYTSGVVNADLMNIDMQRHGGVAEGVGFNGNVVQINGAQGFKMSNCRLDGRWTGSTAVTAENGVWVDGVTRLLITGNNIQNVRDAAIALTNCTNGVVANNSFVFTRVGVNAVSGNANISVEGNNFADITAGGANVTGSGLVLLDQPTPMPPSNFRGALVRLAGDQAVGDQTLHTVGFGTVAYDTDNLFKDTYRFEVPSGVSKVKLYAGQRYNAAGTIHSLFIFRNSESEPVIRHYGSYGLMETMSTPAIPVSPGDSFKMQVWHNAGGGVQLQAVSGTYFAMEIVA